MASIPKWNVRKEGPVCAGVSLFEFLIASECRWKKSLSSQLRSLT